MSWVLDSVKVDIEPLWYSERTWRGVYGTGDAVRRVSGCLAGGGEQRTVSAIMVDWDQGRSVIDVRVLHPFDCPLERQHPESDGGWQPCTRHYTCICDCRDVYKKYSRVSMIWQHGGRVW